MEVAKEIVIKILPHMRDEVEKCRNIESKNWMERWHPVHEIIQVGNWVDEDCHLTGKDRDDVVAQCVEQYRQTLRKTLVHCSSGTSTSLVPVPPILVPGQPGTTSSSSSTVRMQLSVWQSQLRKF
jgi:hypothetical protein